MSDGEDDFYDDEFGWFEDVFFDEDYNYENFTIPSPVIIGYEPTMYPGEDFSDWEYYSDGYYDESEQEDSPKSGAGNKEANTEKPNNNAKGKRKAQGPPTKRGKRRKLSDTSSVPELSLGESVESDFSERLSPTPLIRWRSKDDEIRTPDLVDGKQKKVSLMPDWRERLNVPLRKDSSSEKEDLPQKDKQHTESKGNKRKRAAEPVPSESVPSEAPRRATRQRTKK